MCLTYFYILVNKGRLLLFYILSIANENNNNKNINIEMLIINKLVPVSRTEIVPKISKCKKINNTKSFT